MPIKTYQLINWDYSEQQIEIFASLHKMFLATIMVYIFFQQMVLEMHVFGNTVAGKHTRGAEGAAGKYFETPKIRIPAKKLVKGP